MLVHQTAASDENASAVRCRPGDPLLIISTIDIMVAVAVLASYLPARRASRIDPMVALRYE